MALDERYIVASDLEQYFVDKDSGLPLAAGTIEFFRDISRSTPKPVFQLSGAPPNYTYTSMGTVIDLSAVGTVQNSGGDNEVIYYFPYDEDGELDLYYVVCRNSDGVEQFSREAWPNVTAANDPTQDSVPIFNQISNPQFTNIFLNEGFSTTYTVSGATNEEFAFAPDWDFVISGTGTVIVERVAVTGNEHIVTSPPYVLDVTVSGGITNCYLRQRFNVNSGLWASTTNQQIFLSGVIVARNQGAGTTGLQMFYVESSGGTPVAIVDDSFDNSAYVELNGVTAAAIPVSTNTDSGLDGYIDIYISFLTGSHVRLTSIQVVPTTNQAGADFLQYDTNSSNREQALMGDYFLPNLNVKPIPSLLVGWDFTLNPFQFASSGSLATTAAYICDQTIALRGSVGNITYARSAVTNGLSLSTVGTNDSFYLMQYLSGAQAKKILGTKLSVNVFGYVTSVSDAVTMRVYLFRAPTATAIPTLPTSIGTVNTSGVFTLSAVGWTEIPRSGLDTAKAILPAVSAGSDLNDQNIDMKFTGWELVDDSQINDTDKFAIVVTFGFVDASTAITINSISLIPNAIPCRGAPQTVNQVLEECQYYYEKSYSPTVAPGTVTGVNQIFSTQFATNDTSNSFAYVRGFGYRYNVIKRSETPTLTFYNTASGASASIFMVLSNGTSGIANASVATTNWSLLNSNTEGFSYAANSSSPVITQADTVNFFPEAYIVYHFVSDARLGVV